MDGTEEENICFQPLGTHDEVVTPDQDLCVPTEGWEKHGDLGSEGGKHPGKA